MSALFALDQGFPLPIVRVLADYIEEAELVHLPEIDKRLAADLDDWQLLQALHHHERPWDGLITTDASMLSLPRELCVMLQTKLTVVAAEVAGHDPLKATGLVLSHLLGICRRTRRDVAQVWRSDDGARARRALGTLADLRRATRRRSASSVRRASPVG